MRYKKVYGIDIYDERKIDFILDSGKNKPEELLEMVIGIIDKVAPKINCPKCKSEECVPIAYGFPSERLLERSKKGTVILGGCMVPNNPPTRFCKICKNRW